MEERLRLGISNRDLARGMSKIAGLNYLGDYSHDNIDVGHFIYVSSQAVQLQSSLTVVTKRAKGNIG